MTAKAGDNREGRAQGARSRATAPMEGARKARTRPRRTTASSNGRVQKQPKIIIDPMVLEYAEDVAGRVHSRPVPVRNGFVERLDVADDTDPVLARLLRGGQGGAVRIKLYLSLLWFSVGAGHATDYPARSWAALLGLPQPETNGARRISAALDSLAGAGLVKLESRPGAPTRVTVLDDRGTREPYELPFISWQAAQERGEVTRDDLYLTLSAGLWTKGWISVLSGPAVALLLIMRLEANYARRSTGLWHSPAQFAQRFGLSADTRKVGLAELVRFGILDKRTAPVSPGVFDKKRRRNTYNLHLEQLEVFPGKRRPSLTPNEAQALALDVPAPEVGARPTQGPS